MIHGDLDPLSAALDGSERVEIIEYEDNRVTLVVSSPTDALLLLADAWHPAWRATVNGEPALIYRANLIFRAVPVPAGDSRVSFEFAPGHWRAALVIGIGLWFIMLVILFVSNRPEIERWSQRRRLEEKR